MYSGYVNIEVKKMRINNQNLQAVYKTYNQQKKVYDSKEKGKTSLKNDGLEISSEARFYKTALQALRKVPTENEENILALKEAVKTGSYEIQADDVVEKMAQENMLDKLI